MTERDLIRMPLNRKFEIADNVWHYEMTKKNDENSILYHWKIKGSLNHDSSFFMYEKKVTDEDDGIVYIILMLGMGVGSFRSHVKIDHYELRRCKIVNNNTFKDWSSKR